MYGTTKKYKMKQPELGKKISRIRKQKGLTQEELVEKCNINVRTIQRIEAGEVVPRSYTLNRIIDVLGIEFNEVFFEEKEENTWTKKEKKKIALGSVFGFVFLVVTFLIYVQAQIVNYEVTPLVYEIVFFVFQITCAYFLLNAFRLIAKKHNNKLLERACYIQWLIIIIAFSIDILIPQNENFEGFNYSSLLKFIPIIIGDILFGLGMLKFKNVFQPFAKKIGRIALLSSGILIFTIILLVIDDNRTRLENEFSFLFSISQLLLIIGSFLIFYTKFLEVLFLRDISKEVKFIHDDTVHFVKS